MVPTLLRHAHNTWPTYKCCRRLLIVRISHFLLSYFLISSTLWNHGSCRNHRRSCACTLRRPYSLQAGPVHLSVVLHEAYAPRRGTNLSFRVNMGEWKGRLITIVSTGSGTAAGQLPPLAVPELEFFEFNRWHPARSC